MKWYEYWKDFRMKWRSILGMGSDNYRFHDHENLHYARASDIEFKFPFGFKELEGIHSRTDFDLKHTKNILVKKYSTLIQKSMKVIHLML